VKQQDKNGYKIGFLLPYLSPAGGVRRVFEISNRLSGLGHSVTIYSDDNQKPDWFNLKVKVKPLARLNESTDAILTGWPLFEDRIYKSIKTSNKFWLIQGFNPTYDSKFLLNNEYIKIAFSSYLYEEAKKMSINAYKCIGAINTEDFYPIENLPRQDFVLYNPLKNGERVRELCEKFGIECRPLINLNQQELKYVYGMSLCYIAAEFKSSGWSNPTAEAMACNCPVISTNCGSVRDLIIENRTGLFFDLDEFSTFKNSLYRILNIARLRESIIKNAYNHVRRFSWESVTQSINILIESQVRMKKVGLSNTINGGKHE